MRERKDTKEQPQSPPSLLRSVPRLAGEVTLTGKNQISLPAEGLRAVGWTRGDRILVEVVHADMLLLMRRPLRWADAFAGKLGTVFGGHEDTLAYLEEERRSWDEDARDASR